MGQLTRFLKHEGEDKAEEEESMKAVNTFVADQTRSIERPNTTRRPPALSSTTSSLTNVNGKRIFTDRDPFDIYTDEAIIGNDYDFDYESEKNVQFKFRFKPSSTIQTTAEPLVRVEKENQSFRIQSGVRDKPKTSFTEHSDDRFKLTFDPESGLFSTSVEQFQKSDLESEPKNEFISPEQIHSIQRPKFEIFTLPI